ncbi:Asp-tRNA(Asn)/Glu-tRNA(Gln) amidotransferase subunit GatC [Candidatus Micrarchaeota archaeon]|nr:Asp-tRNA(Asn)/Glu-tRNA(Gln) amidotransferase subunit GatC [Candidatus Micrarchaeota archaeon]
MIDQDTLKKVAQISRLKLSEQEIQELQKDLNTILDYFSKINEIAAKGEEMYYVKAVRNAVRKDLPRKCDKDEKIRKAFNKKQENWLLAPRSL